MGQGGRVVGTHQEEDDYQALPPSGSQALKSHPIPMNVHSWRDTHAHAHTHSTTRGLGFGLEQRCKATCHELGLAEPARAVAHIIPWNPAASLGGSYWSLPVFLPKKRLLPRETRDWPRAHVFPASGSLHRGPFPKHALGLHSHCPWRWVTYQIGDRGKAVRGGGPAPPSLPGGRRSGASPTPSRSRITGTLGLGAHFYFYFLRSLAIPTLPLGRILKALATPPPSDPRSLPSGSAWQRTLLAAGPVSLGRSQPCS